MTNKVCTKCKIEKAVSEFNKRFNKGKNIGYKSHCKKCCNNSRKKWIKANSEKQKEYSAKYRLSVPKEIEAKRCRKKRAKNPEVYRKITKRYRDKTPEKQIAKLAKRRSKKLQATPPWLTKDDFAKITAIYKQAKVLEKATGEKYHVDHIVPLQGKIVSGLHVPWNLQVIKADQNIKKSNKYG